MRLITHNILSCNVKGCKDKDQSLGLTVVQSKLVEKEYDLARLLLIISRLDWNILRNVAVQVDIILIGVVRRVELS